MSSQANPYAAPAAHVEDRHIGTSDDEAIRLEHIKHEASIRSVGMLYYLGGVLTGIAALAFLGLAISGFNTGQMGSFGWILGLVYAAIAILSIAMARGVRNFRPWARTTAIVFSCLGLLGFPVGTLINGYILYLMLSAKGKRIFEPDYADIVAATPHIKYKTPMLMWVLLALLIAFVGFAIFLGLRGA